MLLRHISRHTPMPRKYNQSNRTYNAIRPRSLSTPKFKEVEASSPQLSPEVNLNYTKWVLINFVDVTAR